MSEMVDKVAKTLAEECDGTDANWQFWRVVARAAIGAMKGPTNEQYTAGHDRWKDGGDFAHVYDAMLDAALE